MWNVYEVLLAPSSAASDAAHEDDEGERRRWDDGADSGGDDEAAAGCALVTTDVSDALGEPARAAADVLRRELLRRAMDSGADAPTAYNGRGVWTANYRALLPFDEVMLCNVMWCNVM